MEYLRYIAYRKAWVSPKLSENRITFATTILAKYPYKKDWTHVRFSDEVHFSFGPQGRTYITRKPGERYCANYI